MKKTTPLKVFMINLVNFIVNKVHLSKSDHRQWRISNIFFEKFLGNETNYFNLYNAVINFDLWRKAGKKNRTKIPSANQIRVAETPDLSSATLI